VEAVELKVETTKTIAVVVKFEDVREIRKLESRLWHYGKIRNSYYVREEDEWGRPFIKIGVYSLEVPSSQVSIVKHCLSKLEQRNSLKILHP